VAKMTLAKHSAPYRTTIYHFVIVQIAFIHLLLNLFILPVMILNDLERP